MKKIIIIFTLFCFCFTNCSKPEDEKFSCDTEVNDWVIANKDNLQAISLEEIANLKGEKQRATYRALNPEKRKSLWIKKFKNIIKLYPEYHNIFNNVLEHIPSIDFSEELSEEDVVFFEKIVDKGITKYNWSEEFIGATFYSFEYYNDKHQYNLFPDPPHLSDDDWGDESDLPCNCKWGGIFVCGPLSCISGNCIVVSGCGFMFSQKCTGRCR